MELVILDAQDQIIPIGSLWPHDITWCCQTGQPIDQGHLPAMQPHFWLIKQPALHAGSVLYVQLLTKVKQQGLLQSYASKIF